MSKKLKTLAVIANIDTPSPAAPNPATARPKMRKLTEGAMAQSRLPSSKMPMEIKNTGFGGAMARTLPKNSIKPACVAMVSHPHI
jgi:F420-dependent methylenetetrahydromethanopterin dehydrogenase